ncbi:MAG TPA: 4Fe-4S binding protein [Firmicutes bacterium]|nr:hypothetical protein [Bacillota bacterium]HHV56964.1 4Fe-4S binding protein [Bacillota bacterium]
MAAKRVAVVNEARCDRSPFCPARQSCPAGALRQERLGLFRVSAPKVDPNLCTGCGGCTRVCPHGAITVVAR